MHRAPLSSESSIGLVTLNAKYVHLALSLRYLRNAARAAGWRNTWLREFTIQMPPWKMAAEVQSLRPAVVGFSVYIWNRALTFAVIELLKKQNPALVVVVGGPEVSFECGPPTPHVDYVIGGEGESKWVELLAVLGRGDVPPPETLARWRRYGTDLPELGPLPYIEEDYGGLADKLVYLETSRGCPFTCSFCLSALDERVRFFDDDAVWRQIETLIAVGARRLKFLDRTFNLRKKRVAGLFRRLMKYPGVQFHFEIVGDLLDDALLGLLEEAPPGMFQFEIGIQSADPEVLDRIRRKQNHDRLFTLLARLRESGRVHIHADLIWGLPGESVEQMRASFERALALRPHQLQLGFLKFLPGAPIRNLISAEEYCFQDEPPYEVISHRGLSAEALLDLKRFEEVFDLYYNSGRFAFTLERLWRETGAWETFRRLAAHFAGGGLLLRSHGLDDLYRHLQDCFRGFVPAAELRDLLKLDYFYHHRAHRVPDFLLEGAEGGSAGAAGESPPPGRKRAGRRVDSHTSVAPFDHRIEITGGAALLRASGEPVWYAFTYPRKSQGYFFEPAVTLWE